MSTAIIDTTRFDMAGFDATGFKAVRHGGRSAQMPRMALGLRPERSRLRMTRRGRIVLAVVIALPLTLGAWVALGSVDGAIATDDPSSASFDYVQVESGQSLWQIAAVVAPTEDPRDVVSEIVRLNGLVSSDVFPGQRLGIPEQYRG